VSPVLAITAQQAVGIVLALLVVLAWALWLLANSRKARPEVGSEIELASNRKPYLTDEELEGPKLDRALTWGLVSMAIVAVGLPLYWLAEPGRQSGAVENFNSTFVARGEALFAATAQGGFNCAGCHGGNAGIGGEVPYTLTLPVLDAEGQPVTGPDGNPTNVLRQVSWKAPALNTATLTWTDEQLREILTYGRPFSPMPAWGIEGGGPMNAQQINNLISYLHSIQISADEAKQQATDEANAELERLRNLDEELATAQQTWADAVTSGDDEAARAADATIAGLRAEIALDQPKTMGAALFNMNCARCHTLGWSYDEAQTPGGGAYGPPLHNETNQFPLSEDQVAFVTNGAGLGERYGLNGQSSGRMAFFGSVLSTEQIAAIVEYERTLTATPPAAGR